VAFCKHLVDRFTHYMSPSKHQTDGKWRRQKEVILQLHVKYPRFPWADVSLIIIFKEGMLHASSK